MFNLDEEFSEQEQDEQEEEEEGEEEKKKKPSSESSHDVFGTSWIRKKRNTGKYMTEDFDIARFKNTVSRKDEDGK
jgi:hypothetical protein